MTTSRDDLPEAGPPTVRDAPRAVRGFVLRLDLDDAEPPVWRRLELPGDLRLSALHDVIQVAMGWCDAHLHRFRTGREPWSPGFVSRMDVAEGEEGVLEDDVRLDQVVGDAGDELWYAYDFGDGWDHRLVVETVLDAPVEPRCTAGERACPPEDCGGMPGYEQLVAWHQSGRSDALLPDGFDSRADAEGWLPPHWDPDGFDVDAARDAVAAVVAEPVARSRQVRRGPADSGTLDVLEQLSGAVSLGWRGRNGVDEAVAAAARGRIAG